MEDCKCKKLKAILNSDNNLNAKLDNSMGSTNDYRQLDYIPTINGEKVINDKTSKDYHIQDEMKEISNLELEKLLV